MIDIQPELFPANLGIATKLDLKVSPFSVDALTCSLYYLLYSDSGNIIIQGQLELTQEEYDLWGQDNQYLIDLACEKLGLIIATT